MIFGSCCAPYTYDYLNILKKFDFVTTCSPKFVMDFKEAGIEPLLLYHAFSPAILDKIDKTERINDVVFIGSIVPREGYHIERKKFLEKIAENPSFNFNFFGNISNLKYPEVFKLQMLFFIKQFLNKTRIDNLFKNSAKYKKLQSLNSYPMFTKFSKALKEAYKGELFGIDMYKEYARSKITFDIQVEVEGKYAGNMRMFETTGTGVCLLLEDKINIREIFNPDTEVVIYNSFDDAIEKIKWLMENEDKMKEIAIAGQKRTLKDHTYKLRTEILIDKIKKYI